MASEERPETLQAWTDLCSLVDTVRIALNRQLQGEVGMSLAENLVLCQVAMGPDQRLRMVDLAARLGIAKSAITKTVDRLEDRGLLARQSDPADRRTVYASLTPLGRETFAIAGPAYLSSVEQHFSSALDAADLRHLRRAAAAVLARPSAGGPPKSWGATPGRADPPR
jgi:DNA-binding MarR family transcriptional regulator